MLFHWLETVCTYLYVKASILAIWKLHQLNQMSPLFARGGQPNFFLSPQIANPQFLELIPLSQIRKFLRCDSQQEQIANPPNYCTTLSQNRRTVNVFFLNDFFLLYFELAHLRTFSGQLIIFAVKLEWYQKMLIFPPTLLSLTSFAL